MTSKWDAKFIDLAAFVAQWSKDPSTKVGCVIVDSKRRICGVGYNGFPRGVIDDPELYANRDQKYPRVVHAEANAVLNSSSTEGCTAYVWPLFSCSPCAGILINAGISRVVLPRPNEERWKASYSMSEEMYRQAGVEVVVYEIEDYPAPGELLPCLKKESFLSAVLRFVKRLVNLFKR